MKRRKLGQSGIEVAPLAFGGNVFDWTVDEPTAFQLLDAFASAGFNLIDTADTYPKWVPGNHKSRSTKRSNRSNKTQPGPGIYRLIEPGER